MIYAKLEYHLTFDTPAFVGDADSNAQWRTPPFKALIRQWWRVVVAAESDYTLTTSDLLSCENALFGSAADSSGVQASGKSLVRLRLDAEGDAIAWAAGTNNPGVYPMVATRNPNDAINYSIYPLNENSGGRSINPLSGEATRLLRIACPADEKSRLMQALKLVGSFGQLGKRSRGGWGSLRIPEVDSLTTAELALYCSPLEDCLTRAWPMGFAKDAAGACMWQSQPITGLTSAFDTLARIRKNVRKHEELGKDSRVALGFAKGIERMPSPLRWKINRVSSDSNSDYSIRVFAMPYKMPRSRAELSTSELSSAWHTIISLVDNTRELERLA